MVAQEVRQRHLAALKLLAMGESTDYLGLKSALKQKL
jgi:hypothetical protein